MLVYYFIFSVIPVPSWTEPIPEWFFQPLTKQLILIGTAPDHQISIQLILILYTHLSSSKNTHENIHLCVLPSTVWCELFLTVSIDRAETNVNISTLFPSSLLTEWRVNPLPQLNLIYICIRKLMCICSVTRWRFLIWRT